MKFTDLFIKRPVLAMRESTVPRVVKNWPPGRQKKPGRCSNFATWSPKSQLSKWRFWRQSWSGESREYEPAPRYGNWSVEFMGGVDPFLDYDFGIG